MTQRQVNREKKAAAGRPRRNQLDELKTIAWFTAVMIRSNAGIRGTSRSFGTISAGSLTRYRHGKTTPTAARVAEVEQRYPGTARYFHSPIWNLLVPKWLGTIPLRAVMEGLCEPLRTHFLLGVPEGRTMWRAQTTFVDDVAIVMRQLDASPHDTLDAATAIAYLGHEAVVRQDAERLGVAAEAWARYLRMRDEDNVLWNVPAYPFEAFGRNVYDIATQHGQLKAPSSVARERFGT